MKLRLVVAAAVLALGVSACGDLGTAPSVDELGPQFLGGPPSECPPGFAHLDVDDAPRGVNVAADMDRNGDGHICKGTLGGKIFFIDNRPGH